MSINTNPVRGTRDFGPVDMELRDYVTNKIIEVYKQHGFNRIQTPVLENINLLLNSEGGENLKLIYKILKRGNKLDLNKEALEERDLVDLGLRYDLTLPLSRFYANNSSSLPVPFKSMQIGEVYRAERPQKGRFRSFVQCDIDIIGEEGEIAEVELITTTAKALLALDFNDFVIRINDRRILKRIIEYAGFDVSNVNSVCVTFDKLDKIGYEGVEEELNAKGYDQKIVDKFIQTIKAIVKSNIDEIINIGTDKEIIEPLMNVINIVDKQSNGRYKVKYDPSLVRGMGYYTGIIFEIESEGLGVSIAGGGRYDKMIGRFMKKNVPAVGFSIGFERIISILQDKGFIIPNNSRKTALLYDKKEDTIKNVIEQAECLRKDCKIVSTIPKQKKVGKQLQQLKEQGFNSFCIYKDQIEVKELN